MRDHVAEVVRHLERIADYGHRSHTVFEDWLALVEASLDALPALASAAASGQDLMEVEETPEAVALWERLRDRYRRPKEWERFSRAFAVLIDSSDVYQDVLGQVYMAFAYPNPGAGQFFTPWNVAHMMARMTLEGEGPAQVHRRLQEAISKSLPAQAALMAGLGLEGEQAFEWYLNRVIPAAIEHYEPVTVLDPAVGSGVMLLAAASCYPSWMVRLGLVQFYGQDIDRTCVQMARINLRLYGMNGHGLKWACFLTDTELGELPQPHRDVYREAREAHEEGDQERLQAITEEWREYQQLSLFA